MSVKVMSQVFEGFPEGGSRLLVMLAMADFARDDGSHIWPSVPTLAHKVRLGDRQVRYILKSLVDDGFLVIEKQGEGGNAMGTTHYSIRAESLSRKIETPAPECSPADESEPPTPAPECTPDTEDRGAEGAADCTPQTPALECTPALRRVDPCTGVPQPLHPSAPNPSLTVINHHHQRADAGAREAAAPPVDGGGGGFAAREAQASPCLGVGGVGGVVSTLHPAPTGESLARARRCLDAAEAHRRESAVAALVAAGVADPGTRDRLADLPLVTAALVRRVRRETPPKLGPGALVNAITTAAQQALFAQGKAAAIGLAGDGGDAEAGPTAPAESPQVERTRREREQAAQDLRQAMIDDRMTLLALRGVEPERLERERAALIHDRPELAHMYGECEVLARPMLRVILADRLEIDCEPFRDEATREVDERLQSNHGVTEGAEGAQREAVMG